MISKETYEQIQIHKSYGVTQRKDIACGAQVIRLIYETGIPILSHRRFFIQKFDVFFVHFCCLKYTKTS